MIYLPNPKSLVYSELYFISTSRPREVVVTMDSIIDEVSSEVYELFFGEAYPAAQWDSSARFTGSERPVGTEMRN